MKKVKVITVVFFFISFISSAQFRSKKTDVLWSLEQQESNKYLHREIVGHDHSGIYIIQTENNNLNSTITIEHYDSSLVKSKSNSLSLKNRFEERSFEFIIQLNNKFHLFSSLKNQQLKRNILFVQSINTDSLQLNQDLKKIAEIDYTGKNKFNIKDFKYELSGDSSKVLIYYKLPFNKNDKEQYNFLVFDKNLNQLWQKEIILPYKEELFDLEKLKLDNNGNVHLSGIKYVKKQESKRSGDPNFNYRILSYHNHGNILKVYPVRFEDKLITDMNFNIDMDRNIICSGLYAEKGSFNISGVFFIRINSETNMINSSSFKNFGVDFIEQNIIYRQEINAEKKPEKNIEFYNYGLKDIISNVNGGFILIAEQYFIREVTTNISNTNSFASNTSSFHYNYNDIIVINISPDDSIEWVEKIPKKQITVNDGGLFSSYTRSLVNDKLYFIFNDNPKNLFYKRKGKVYNYTKGKESLVFLVELDSKGFQTREALFSSRDENILVRPGIFKQISENELILFSQRKITHRFAKIKFN